MKFLVKCAITIAVAASLAGCGRTNGLCRGIRGSIMDYDKAAMRTQEWIDATACMNSNDIDGAMAKYAQVCEHHPRAATPHLQLASILHHRRHDYIGAIYNYRMFLQKTSDDSNLARITNMMKMAENELSKECASRISPSGLPQTMRVELKYRSLNNAIASARAENRALAASNAVLVAEMQELNGKINQRLTWIDKLRHREGAE